jgi:ABC-2 type transport system ATP-binding protein
VLPALGTVAPYSRLSGRRWLVYEAKRMSGDRDDRLEHAVVRCRGLVKQYPRVCAVDGIDLDIARAQCFGLLGPNGAGKTTTVEVIEGLVPPTRGKVEVLGQRWGVGHDDALRQRMGIALQETHLSDLLTVEETIRLFRSFYARGRTVEAVIDMMALNEKRTARVAHLSGGQRQRLALGCALVGDPELMFLDEPTTGLDPQARLKIWEVVETFKAAGGTVVLTTHYMEEAARLCDRVAIIDRGKIIAEDTPTALVAELGAEQIVELELDGDFDPAGLRSLPGVTRHQRQGATHVLTVEALASCLPALLSETERQGARLQRLTSHEPTLEDVFVQRTGRALRDA